MDHSRRDILWAGAAGLGTLASRVLAEEKTPEKPLRIGLLSASIHGKPQPRNGHTWHFCHYLHPEFDDAAYKTVYPQSYDSFKKIYRNPNYNFGVLPFPNTR